MTGTMTWAAMDVHARSTYAASLDVVTGELSRQRFDTGAVEPVVGWLAGLPGPVRACYQAGPTGFGLYRAAVAAGIDCQVIAPSKTPRPSGDRNKSDRRDTDLLLRQLMAGALTPVTVPSATFEAARDLARAREQVRLDLMRCRHRLSKLAVAPWPRVGPHCLDSDAPSVALSTDLRSSEHRAGVHRQPRRLRRAERPPASARRAALVDRAGPEFWPLVRRLRVPGDRHALGVDRGARGRRLRAVRSRGAARIVTRTGALAPAIRRIRRARVDHQDRLQYARRILVEAAWHYARPPRIGGRSQSATRGCPTTSCRSPPAPNTASTGSTAGCESARSPAT